VVLPAGYDNLEHAAIPKKSEFGDMIQNNFSQTIGRGNLMVMYMIYPEAMQKAKTVPTVISDAVNAVKAIPNLTISHLDGVSVDGNQARAFDLQAEVNGKAVYGHTIIAATRTCLYTFQFISFDQAELTKPDVKKFFSSIQIQK